MINNSQIIGIYEYKISIPTMFNNYELAVKNHNIITWGGEKFFLEKWINKDYTNVIDTVSIGTTEESAPDVEASKTDTDLDSSSKTNFTNLSYKNNRNYLKITVDKTNDGNELKGDNLLGAYEIGLRSKLSDGSYLLITHDIHDKLTLPSTSAVCIDYYLYFDYSVYKYNFTQVTSKSYYKTTLDENVKLVLDGYTEEPYIKVSSLTELTSTGEYYLNKETDETYTLYVYPYNSENLLSYGVLITYDYEEEE